MTTGSIYQGSLLSFGELKRTYSYFNANPLVNGGYEKPTEPLKKSGIFYARGKKVQDSNSNWVTSSSQTLWSTEELLQGYFIEFEGVVYRLMNDKTRVRQGGFYVYDLEERIGNSTFNQYRPVAETGSNEFT